MGVNANIWKFKENDFFGEFNFRIEVLNLLSSAIYKHVSLLGGEV